MPTIGNVNMVYDTAQPILLPNGVFVHPPIPVLPEGSDPQQIGDWTTNGVFMVTGTTPHPHQESNFAYIRSAPGSGANGSQQSDSALLLGVEKPYPDFLTTNGEIDTLFVYNTQGVLGDSSGILFQIDRLDDGVTANYGTSVFEAEAASHSPNGSQPIAECPIIRQLNVQAGVILTSPTSDNLPTEGFRVEAQQGVHGAGLLVDSLDLSGGARPPSWQHSILVRRDRSLLPGNIYFDLVGSGLILRGIDPGTGPTFTLDTVDPASSNLIAYAQLGAVKLYAGLFNDGTYRLFDAVDGLTVLSTSGGNLTLGVSGKTLALDTSLTLANQTAPTGSATATLTNAPIAGNPAGWLAIGINGSPRNIPFW